MDLWRLYQDVWTAVDEELNTWFDEYGVFSETKYSWHDTFFILFLSGQKATTSDKWDPCRDEARPSISMVVNERR